MNRIIMMGCISLCVLFSLVASGQYVYDGSGLYAELNSDTMVFSLGSIQSDGTVNGIPAEGFIDTIDEISMDPIINQYIPQSLIENLHIFPLLGSITEMTISNLTIISGMRNNGVGTKLVESFEEWAKEKGMKYVITSTVQENIIGLNFYRKRDFQIIEYDLRKML